MWLPTPDGLVAAALPLPQLSGSTVMGAAFTPALFSGNGDTTGLFSGKGAFAGGSSALALNPNGVQNITAQKK